MPTPAAGADHAFRRLFVLEHRLAPQGLTILPENSLFVVGFWDAPSIDAFSAGYGCSAS
jgi:hypothetical protein